MHLKADPESADVSPLVKSIRREFANFKPEQSCLTFTNPTSFHAQLKKIESEVQDLSHRQICSNVLDAVQYIQQSWIYPAECIDGSVILYCPTPSNINFKSEDNNDHSTLLDSFKAAPYPEDLAPSTSPVELPPFVLPWLLRATCILENLSMEGCIEADDVLNQICRCISSLCGKGSIGTLIRTWTFPHSNGQMGQVPLYLAEASFGEADLGGQQWGSSVVLSMCVSYDFIFPSLQRASMQRASIIAYRVSLRC
jgi:hypothetical protein